MAGISSDGAYVCHEHLRQTTAQNIRRIAVPNVFITASETRVRSAPNEQQHEMRKCCYTAPDGRHDTGQRKGCSRFIERIGRNRSRRAIES